MTTDPCTHSDTVTVDPVLNLVRCTACDLVGTATEGDPGAVAWSGYSRRDAEFNQAMDRLRDVAGHFGLLAECRDVQTATLLERILRDVATLVSRGDFAGLQTLMLVGIQLGERAQQDRSKEIIHYLVKEAGGQVRIPDAELRTPPRQIWTEQGQDHLELTVSSRHRVIR